MTERDGGMARSPLTQELLRNRGELMGFIYALTRDFAAAEEVFQEVALAILEEAEAGRTVRPFMPWAREVARRRVAEHYRRAVSQGRVRVLSPAAEETVCRCFAESEAPDGAGGRRLQYLLECLAECARRTREIVELRYGRKLAAAEIAAELGWTPAAVNVALSRARKFLAECVGRKLRRGGE